VVPIPLGGVRDHRVARTGSLTSRLVRPLFDRQRTFRGVLPPSGRFFTDVGGRPAAVPTRARRRVSSLKSSERRHRGTPGHRRPCHPVFKAMTRPSNIDHAVARIRPKRYTVTQAAALVGRSPDTLRRWRRQGVAPPSETVTFGKADRVSLQRRRHQVAEGGGGLGAAGAPTEERASWSEARAASRHCLLRLTAPGRHTSIPCPSASVCVPAATKTGVHRDAVKLFETMRRLLPEGEQWLQMNLSDVGREAGRPFVAKGEVDKNRVEAAWRYLRDIGSVALDGPRFKVLKAHPGQLSNGPPRSKEAKVKREAPRRSGKARPKAGGNGSGVTSEDLRRSLDSLLTHIDEGLSEVKALREAADARLTAIQERHNQLVGELADFRQEIQHAHLAAFVDERLGDELWVYEIV
jgi:hypothetical protein